MPPEEEPNFEDDYIAAMAKQAFPVGSLVAYRPSLSSDEQFAGRIADEPFKLSGGDWVVKLIDMQPSYAIRTGKSGDKSRMVYAASLSNLSLLARANADRKLMPTPWDLCNHIVAVARSYETHGWDCEFQGCGMVYASVLDELGIMAKDIIGE